MGRGFLCWAAVAVKISTETTDAGITNEVLSLEFTVRRTLDTMRVNPTTHRISYHGITYNIDSIIPNYRSFDYMKITAGTQKAGEHYDFY